MQQYRSGNRFFMKNITNRDEFMEKFFLLISNALQSFTGNHYSKHYKSEKLDSAFKFKINGGKCALIIADKFA